MAVARSDVESANSRRRLDWVSSIVEEVRVEGERSDQRLRELGYRNDFRRDMSVLGVLGLSFCAVGILTGMSSAFQTALFSGGPLGLFWGWNVSVCLCVLCRCGVVIGGRERGRVIDHFGCVDLQRVHAAHRAVPRGDMQCIVSTTPACGPWVNCTDQGTDFVVLRWAACTSGCAR